MATELYWSGAGTWNTAATSWGTAPGGPYNTATWSNSTPDSAVFENTPGTVTLGEPISAGGLSFAVDGYSVTGSTLTLSGNTSVSAGTATIGSAIAGSLTKAGAGTLTLTANNPYSGNTTVSEGVLNLGVGARLSNSPAISVASGATLNLNGNANNQIQLGFTRDTPNIASLAISGTMNVGSAIHTMYASSISMTNGTINFNNANGWLWMPARTITFNGGSNAVTGTSNLGLHLGLTGSTLTLDTPLTTDAVSFSVPLTAAAGGNLTKAGAGTLTLSTTNTYTGATTILAGALTLTGQISSGAGAVSMRDDTSLNVTASGSNPAINTTGAMTVGSDFENPAGMNTITFDELSNLSVAPISVGSLFLDSPVTVNIAGVSPVVGQYPLFQYTGEYAVHNLSLGSLPNGFTATLVDDIESKSIYLDVTAAPLVDKLYWSGAGTWNTADSAWGTAPGGPYNTATWSNSTPVSAILEGTPGTVTLGEPISAGGLTFAVDGYSVTGSTLTLSGITTVSAGTTTIGSAIAGNLTKEGVGALVLTGNSAGLAIVSAGTLQFGNGTIGNDGIKGAGAIINDASVIYNYAGDQTVAYGISGTGSVIKNGASTLRFSTSKTYTGGTTVEAGTLRLDGGGGPNGMIRGILTINSGATVQSDGTGTSQWALGYGDATQAVSSIIINGGTLNFESATSSNTGTAAATITMTGGAIGGSQAWDWFLGQTTTPTLNTLAAATTATVVNLRPRLGSAGSVTFNVAEGNVTGGPTPGVDLHVGAINYNFDPGAAIIKDGAGVLELSGNNTYTGNTTILAGALTLTGQISSGAGAVSMRDDTSLNVTASGSNPAINTTGAMTVGSDFENPAGMNTITFDELSNLSVAPISVGSLFLDSPVTVNIAGVSPVVGQYPLFQYTGEYAVHNLSLGSLPNGFTAALVDDIESKSIYLNVTAVPGSGAPFDAWAASFNLIGDEALPGADPDEDGLSNLLEFVLGGNPTSGAQASVVPGVQTTASDLILTFNRSSASKLQPVGLKVQISGDLNTWDLADDIVIGATSGSSYTVTEMDGYDLIVVTISKSGPMKFARVTAELATAER